MSDKTPGHIIDIPGNPCPQGAKTTFFSGPDGNRVRACLIPPPTHGVRGTCIVCPGRTEFIEKYFEVARALQDRGLAVVILDWPGQGLSHRFLGDRLKGHIDRFDTYCHALKNSLAAFDTLPQPHIVLAHSMGGTIALHAIEQHVIKAEAAAFCAPMWGLGLKWWQHSAIRLMCLAGRSHAFAVKPGPPERFEDNIVTRDKGRWQINRDLTDKEPGLALGPVTWGWLGAAVGIMPDIIREKRLRAVAIPILVASADDEKLVDNRAHTRAARFFPDCEHITVQHAMHEILMETDDRRAAFWDGFDRLLDRAGI